MPKTLAGEPFRVSQNLLTGKVYESEGVGLSRFTVENFCRRVPRKFVGEPFSVSLFSDTEKVWIRVGEYQDSPCETFLSRSAENSVGGILYCCINFGHRKNLDNRGVSIKIFLSKIICLTVPKLSVVEPFSVSLISGSDKIYEEEVGGGIKICRRKLFVSQCPNFP